MKTRSLLVVAAASGLLVAAVSLPASAGTSGTTTANMGITAGVISITVPVAAGSLGSVVNQVGGGTVSGSVGEVQVSDARTAAAGSGWVASVISSAFTPGTGTATYTANNPGDLTGVSPAVTATGITGDNSATWNPTITIAVPGGLAPNTYFATITHSVL